MMIKPSLKTSARLEVLLHPLGSSNPRYRLVRLHCDRHATPEEIIMREVELWRYASPPSSRLPDLAGPRLTDFAVYQREGGARGCDGAAERSAFRDRCRRRGEAAGPGWSPADRFCRLSKRRRCSRMLSKGHPGAPGCAISGPRRSWLGRDRLGAVGPPARPGGAPACYERSRQPRNRPCLPSFRNPAPRQCFRP
jgi:hypothetical protein